MGRLSEKIKSAAPKRRKLAGLERRWLINNVSVMVVLAALCVGLFLRRVWRARPGWQNALLAALRSCGLMVSSK